MARSPIPAVLAGKAKHRPPDLAEQFLAARFSLNPIRRLGKFRGLGLRNGSAESYRGKATLQKGKGKGWQMGKARICE